MLVNQDQLAEIFGVSLPTIQAWQTAGMPYTKAEKRGQANTYETAAVIEWRIASATEKAAENTSKGRLDRLKVIREELSLRREIGELVNVELVAGVLDRYVSEVSNILDGMPESFAVRIENATDANARHAQLREFVKEIRNALADFDLTAALAGTGGGNRGVESRPGAPGDSEVQAAA